MLDNYLERLGAALACIHLQICYPHRLPDSADKSPLSGLPLLPSRRSWLRARQARLFCSCGETRLLCSGLCRTCYGRQAHSRLRFAGHRLEVLARDAGRCQGCGSDRKLAVHHRRPGVHDPRLLITLCAACHARVHRLRAMRHWLEPTLVPFWQEQHPRMPLQLQFPWNSDS